MSDSRLLAMLCAIYQCCLFYARPPVTIVPSGLIAANSYGFSVPTNRHFTVPRMFLLQNDYKQSSRWGVVNVTATRLALPPHDPDPIVVLVYELYLRRRMVFSTYMLTLPCVFLACLTLVVFSLPPERPDRTALGRYCLFSFIEYLLHLGGISIVL